MVRSVLGRHPPLPDKIQRSISKQYEFEKSSTKKFSELLNNTVDEIRLYTDETVAVGLRNRQYIGRKEIYNGTDYICSSEKTVRIIEPTIPINENIKLNYRLL